MVSIPLSVGQIEDTLRRAGVDLGRVQQYTGRQELSGESGKDILFRELTGREGGFSQEEVLNRQRAEQEGRLAAQRGEEEAFLGRFRGTISGFEPLTALSERIGTEMGIPALSEQYTQFGDIIADLQGTLQGLGARVQQETTGFGVTAGQLGRMREAREIPLREQLIGTTREAEKVGGRLTGAQQALQQRLGLEQTEREFQLKPFALEADLLSDRIAREMTLFTKQQENELTLLIDRIQAGRELDAAEQQRLQDLADAEQSFINQKELIRFQTDEDIRQTLATRTGRGTTTGFATVKGEATETSEESLRRLEEQGVLTSEKETGAGGGSSLYFE